MKRLVRIRRKNAVNRLDLPHVGRLDAPVYMVLDPVVGSRKATMPLSKSQMEWFAGHVKAAGFKRSDVCIVSCAPPVDSDTWTQGKLINAHLKLHRQELVDLIARNKPKFIMPFGAKACQQVIGRAVQITKVRGQPIQDPDVCMGIPMLPMLSPFYAQRMPENEVQFANDIQTAGRIYSADFDLDASMLVYEHEYQWVYDLQWLIDRKPKRISVDTEGIGLIPFSPKTTILTVQICYEKGKSVIIPINYDRGKYRHHNFIPWDTIDRNKLIGQLKQLLEDPNIEKIGQNFKFDWLMFWYKLGIETKNYAHEYMLLAHLLDENQKRQNLDDLTRRYVPEMAGYADMFNQDPTHLKKSRMDLVTPDDIMEYGCGDTDAVWRGVHKLIKKVQADKGLHNTYRYVTMPAQRAFCYIELNGFPVSEDELDEFEKQLREHQKRERGYILTRIPESIKAKYRNTGVGLKATRAVMLRDWLYHHEDGLQLEPKVFTKTKQPSISSKQALPFYVADHPVLARLMDYIKNDKMLNTYAKGFHKYIFDGLIRPSYGLAGTVTGRSMSRDPNGQNFPKRGKLAKQYRKIFKAPKGWVFLSCDLSQAELRIAAMMSGDPNMLKVYADGGDIHRTTAAGVMGISVEEFLKLPKEEQDLKRFQAKAVNFGFLYGMWWVKFRSYAKTDYGIDFTEEEARTIREMFFRTYPLLEDWHRYVQRQVAKHGFIRTFDGRIRHLPNVKSPDEGIAKQAMRQGINSPVQSIASDLGLMTLGRLMPYLRTKGYDKWLKPCGFIHDAIVCLVREDKAAEGASLVKRFMENNPVGKWFDWEPEIPIIADAEIGRTLAQTYELKADQFVGKRKSYVDLLNEELAALRAKRKKETDTKALDKLKSSIASIEADIALSVKTPSRRVVRRATISKQPGASQHASRQNTCRPQKVRRRVVEAA